MAQRYPWPSPQSPNSPSPKSSKRPSLPSIASSSIYLTPVQEQRINSWRKHASPGHSPLPPSPVPTITPALTRSDSTGSPLSASLHAAVPPPVLPAGGKAKVRSAPASLVAPAAGSQCQACGGSCGCSTVSRNTHPTGRNTMSQAPRDGGAGPSVPRNFAPFTPLTTIDTETGSGSGTGSGSKVRSYYSTKKYRQARAAMAREQSGFGQGGADMSSTSNLRSGSGLPPGYAGREGDGAGGGQYNQGGMNEPMNQYPPGMQPEWGPTEPEPIPEREFSYVQAQPPVALPIPRIAGARDPITQQYWRGMYPPVGGLKGTNPGMPMPMMGMGMGMFHPPMAGMPGMMPFH